MNTILVQLQKWLAELGIQTKEQSACLMVSRDGITNFGTIDEILTEIKTSVNKRIFVSYRDDDWVHFDVI